MSGNGPMRIADVIYDCRGHQLGRLVERFPPPVRSKIIRRVVFVTLLLAIVAVVRLWPDRSASEPTLTSAGKHAQDAASASSAKAIGGSPTAPAARGTAMSDAATGQQGAPIQITVRAPGTVQQGESFQVAVDLEANGGIRQLAFSLTYNKRVLQLLGYSEGPFVRQWGTPAELSAQEPSDGNVLVRLDVNNGLAIAGAGSLAILEFQALKAGTSPVTVDNITFVEDGSPRTSTTPSVHEALVKVE